MSQNHAGGALAMLAALRVTPKSRMLGSWVCPPSPDAVPSSSFEFVLHACSQGQGVYCVHLQETGIRISQQPAMTSKLRS